MYLGQKGKVLGGGEAELGAVLSGGEELVEDVEVALVGLLPDQPALLQQVVVDARRLDLALRVEVDLHPLAEPGRVVVPQRLGIPKRLQHRVRHQDLVLHGTVRPRHFGQEREHLLRALRLVVDRHGHGHRHTQSHRNKLSIKKDKQKKKEKTLGVVG